MIRVRCILVETTVPVRIRPRMETRPVKGHFLSVGGRWSVMKHLCQNVALFSRAQLLLPLPPPTASHWCSACLLLTPTIAHYDSLTVLVSACKKRELIAKS